MIAISNSEMQTWLRCPRKWYVSYYLGMVPADDVPVSHRWLGIRVHAALEGQFGHGLDAALVLKLLYSSEIQLHPEFEGELRAECDLALAMVEGLLEWLPGEALEADLELVAAEREISVPLPGFDGVMLRGKLDQVVGRKSNGTLYFRDWKTAASFEKHEVLALDPQFRFYSLMQRLAVMGMADPPLVMGGLITTLRRVKRTERAKPPFYQTDEFRYNDAVLEATWRKVTQVVKEILAARAELDAGGQPGDLTHQAVVRPVPILHDCAWSCPLAGGLCVMMDDGSAWEEALLSSGRWVRQDPYDYYHRDPLASVRRALSDPGNLITPGQGEDQG